MLILFGFTAIAFIATVRKTISVFNKCPASIYDLQIDWPFWCYYVYYSCFFVKFSKSPTIKKILDFFSGLKEGILSVLKMKKKGLYIFHSFLIWGLYLLSFYTATFALKETASISFFYPNHHLCHR